MINFLSSILWFVADKFFQIGNWIYDLADGIGKNVSENTEEVSSSCCADPSLCDGSCQNEQGSMSNLADFIRSYYRSMCSGLLFPVKNSKTYNSANKNYVFARLYLWDGTPENFHPELYKNDHPEYNYLFTEHELETARERAKNNPEDCPTDVADLVSSIFKDEITPVTTDQNTTTINIP